MGYSILWFAVTVSWSPQAVQALQIFSLCSFILTIVNFFPASPLDGGLILQTLLESKLDKKAAYLVAAKTSIALLSLVVLGSLFYEVYVLAYLGTVMMYDNFQNMRRIDSAGF